MAKKLTAEDIEIGGEVFSICYLDPDYRPNTAGKEHVCCVCSREIKRPLDAQAVHLVEGGMFALKVSDEARYTALNAKQPGGQFAGERGFHEIGPECARKLPKGFVHPALTTTGAV